MTTLTFPTNIYDVDYIILQLLDDDSLRVATTTNQYIYSLLQEDSFWITRLKNKFTINEDVWPYIYHPETAKSLYAKLTITKHEVWCDMYIVAARYGFLPIIKRYITDIKKLFSLQRDRIANKSTKRGHIHITQYLLAEKAVSVRSVAYGAIDSNYYEFFVQLVDERCPPKFLGEVLSYALTKRRVDMARYLLDMGVDISDDSYSSDAVLSNRLNIIDLVIEYGMNIYTLIYTAIIHNNYAVLEYLIIKYKPAIEEIKAQVDLSHVNHWDMPEIYCLLQTIRIL